MKQLDIQTACNVIAEILRVSPEDANLDENTDLKDCGLTSMDFVLCSILLEEHLEVPISYIAFQSIRTVGDLVAEVNRELSVSK
jgi:acyl carrier protein